MEVCFDLLIPKMAFSDGFLLQEQLLAWGDESLSQAPRRFTYNDKVKFKLQTIPEYLLGYIPSELNVTDWACLSLECDALEDWEKSVNDLSYQLPVGLKCLLDNLLELLNQWVVIFELNCDQIDNVYQMDKSMLLEKIEVVLNWNNQPEGFVAWHTTR